MRRVTGSVGSIEIRDFLDQNPSRRARWSRYLDLNVSISLEGKRVERDDRDYWVKMTAKPWAHVKFLALTRADSNMESAAYLFTRDEGLRGMETLV